MGGWRWASADDVNALFNHYLSSAGIPGEDFLGPGPDAIQGDMDSPWITAFYSDGWNWGGGWIPDQFVDYAIFTAGWIATPLSDEEGFMANVWDTQISPSGNADGLASNGPVATKNYSASYFGVWL